MTLTDIQQLHKLIEDSENILLIFGSERKDDCVASALALKIFLEKQNKQALLCSHNFVPANHLRFLPSIHEIRANSGNLRKTTIKVDVTGVKLESVSYEIKENWLSIFLTPKDGAINKENIQTMQSGSKFDLIITVGINDLESLGVLFFQNIDLFYKTPIVNFDNHAGNEHFGQINIVEINASSNAEVIFRTLEQLSAAHIDENIAICLLTGIISQTNSFRTPNVAPSTLNIASRLMNLGADREKIIHNLYRTKSISSLKLWGKALNNLQHDRKLGIAWTTLTRDDFIRADAKEEDLRGIAVELISNAPEARTVLLLHEFSDAKHLGKIRGILTTDKDQNAFELIASYNPEGNKKIASFILEEKTLNEATEEIVEEIKKQIVK
ncbi:hypothetical protein KKA13_04670 [Patescibacteria group bacterium]|nr:hypothetical protein [Patescibacteria group bacterium]